MNGERKTALITGGNSGIGLECARALVQAGWKVRLASRDRAASQRAVEELVRSAGAPVADALDLDLGSLSSVRDFARELERGEAPVHALVLNAGLQGPTKQLSAEGFERTFAVNHLGHFLLANLLLPRLAANAPARLIVVASGVHDDALATGMPKPAITDFDTLAETGGPRRGEWNGQLAYVNSKLCNLWFTYELARRVSAAGLPITVNAWEPGLVPGSGLARDYPVVLRWIWEHVGPLLAEVATRFTPMVNPAHKSGAALARMVVSPEFASVHGRYFPSHTRWEDGASSLASYDEARALELWDASVRMAKLDPNESALVA